MGRLVLLVAALSSWGCGMDAMGAPDAGADGAASGDAPSLDTGAPDASDAGTPCTMTSDCAPDEYCTVCGGLHAGACEPRPRNCDDAVQPVCGCGGIDYLNDCRAHAAGRSAGTACYTPPGWFRCGLAHYCNPETSYCDLIDQDDAGVWCRPLPPACAGTTDCDCFGGTVSNGLCRYAGGGFTWIPAMD